MTIPFKNPTARMHKMITRKKGYFEQSGNKKNLVITTPNSRGIIVDVSKKVAEDLGARGIYPSYSVSWAMRSPMGIHFPYRKRINEVFSGGDRDEMPESSLLDTLIVELDTIEDTPADLVVGCSFTPDEAVWHITEEECAKKDYVVDSFQCPNEVCHMTVSAHNSLKKKNSGTESNFLSLYLNEDLVEMEDEAYLKGITDLIKNIWSRWANGDNPEGKLCNRFFARVKAGEIVNEFGVDDKAKIMSLNNEVVNIEDPVDMHGGDMEFRETKYGTIYRVFYPENGYCFVKIPRSSREHYRKPYGMVDVSKAKITCGDKVKWLKESMRREREPFDEMGLFSYLKKIK